MDIDPVASVLAARTAATQNTIQLAVLKKSHEMELALLQMVDQQARAAPPPGQGTRVDKLA
ncbi:MAG: hypothetical protein ACTHLT_18050 [Devosia sp.]